MSTSAVETPARSNPGRAATGPRRWILATVVVLTGLCIFYAIVLTIFWPFTKQALIDTLQESTLRTVTVQSFHSTYFPPGCVAENIAFERHVHKNKPPIIFISKLQAEATYFTLLTFQHDLSVVRLLGIQITVPPAKVNGKPNPIMPLNSKSQGRGISIGTILADGATLDLMWSDPNERPYRIAVDRLAIHSVGRNTSIPYRVDLKLEDPPGAVHSEGVFGPWNPQDPGRSPMHGSYSYTGANLAALKGVVGILNSHGSFTGTLKEVQVKGKADVSNFKVADTAHARALNASYDATIDGVHGNVLLEDVTAQFDGTTVDAKGSITGEEEKKGKRISLELSSDDGRIEDLVRLFASAPRSPMTGRIVFRGKLNIPPGDGNFVERMNLLGSFGITSGRFTDRELEEDISRLSQSGTKGKEKEKPVDVLSDLKARIRATKGIAHLTQVSFSVPGAHADLDGTYNLMNYTTDMYGLLTTQGSVSDATTGFKSFALKVMTPFFKKRHHVKIVGFKLSGKYGHTNMNVDLDAASEMRKRSQ
ncbi:MAG: hypothetical protein JO033_17690 [Acidobacteriaceae bacterium]|nr:hypothetical protein [Acidobacteriaceae bacterium]